MQVILRQDEDQGGEKVHWEYEKVQYDWVNVGPELSKALEAGFKSGQFYSNRSLSVSEGRGCYAYCATDHGQFEITGYYCDYLEGMRIQFDDNDEEDDGDFKLRRKGPRVKVKGEEAAVKDHKSVLEKDDRCIASCTCTHVALQHLYDHSIERDILVCLNSSCASAEFGAIRTACKSGE